MAGVAGLQGWGGGNAARCFSCCYQQCLDYTTTIAHTTTSATSATSAATSAGEGCQGRAASEARHALNPADGCSCTVQHGSSRPLPP